MAILQALLAVDSFTDGADMMISSLTRLITSLDSSYRTMQKFEITISTFSGGLEQAGRDLDILLASSNRLGVSFEAAAAPFAKFASASDNLSKSQIFEIFDSFATSLSAVRANGSEVNGVFLALQQIVSKGKLSMEELRLQLAERIPGAMRLAAQAVNMSMTEFEESVRKGTIDTSEWLIKFSKLLKDKFAVAAELAAKSFDAQIQVLNNNLLILKAGIVEVSGAGDIWASIIKSINDNFVTSSEKSEHFTTMLRDLSNMFMDIYNIVEPLLSPAIYVLTGAVSLLAREMAAVASVSNMLFALLSGLRTRFLEVKESYLEMTNAFGQNKKALVDIASAIAESKISSIEYLIKAKEAGDRFIEPFKLIGKEVEYIDVKLKNMSEAVEKNIGDFKKLSDSISKDIKTVLEEKEDAAKKELEINNEMYREAGLKSDTYYDNEATDIFKKVAKWQEAGADVYESNEWLYGELIKLSEEAGDAGADVAARTMEEYAAMSTSMVTDFGNAESDIQRLMGDIQVSIDDINTSEINIQARLDGSAVVTGLEDIISKMKYFKEVATASDEYKYNYDAESDGDFSDWAGSRGHLDNDNTNNSNSGGTTVINNNNLNMSKSQIADLNNLQQNHESSL